MISAKEAKEISLNRFSENREQVLKKYIHQADEKIRESLKSTCGKNCAVLIIEPNHKHLVISLIEHFTSFGYSALFFPVESTVDNIAYNSYIKMEW